MLKRRRPFLLLVVIGLVIYTFWWMKCPTQSDIVLEYSNENDAKASDAIQEESLAAEKQSIGSNCRDAVDMSTSTPAVELAFVVGGQRTARSLATVIKSLVFYRREPLRLHLVVDKPARRSLHTLLRTWGLLHVSVAYYDLEPHLQKISWISNRHYSSIYGLVKLILPSILPDSLSKVIVLDVDIVAAADIADLWKYFREFNGKQAIGLVENQSPWYLGKVSKAKPWPALGRGFNTGVSLLWLTRLRSINWARLWQTAAKRSLPKFGPTLLADQDIMNAVIVMQPWIVFKLPCQWNVQLADRVDTWTCPLGNRPDNRFKIIHLNSPKKYMTVANSANIQNLSGMNIRQDVLVRRRYFAAVYQTFIEYDGNLLRRDLYSLNLPCDMQNGGVSTTKNNSLSDVDSAGDSRVGLVQSVDELPASHSEIIEDECYEMRAEQRLTRRTHLFYLKFNYSSGGDNDVTIVSQLSLDRLQLLEDLARHWEGPMSVAVYVSDSEAYQLLQFVENSPLLSIRHNIAYHVVYREGQFYPVNHLRNIAMDNAPTNFVFQLDFDFLPSHGLYPYLKKSIDKLILQDSESSKGNAPRICLVIPAFETFQYKLAYPENKVELLSRLNTGEVLPFRQEVWRAGHSATDYTQWKTATRPYEVHWDADYEPYVVVSKYAAQFDSRFIGFGWNKVAYMMALDVLSYRMMVLPNAFAIHLPHAPSLDVARFRTTPIYRDCINRFKVEYIRYLAKKYGVRALKYLEFRRDLPL